jgi:hypothetical protein
MIARCLRELGRRADASIAYANAAAEATRRVAKGEAKYAQTAEAATAEGAAVRGQLGTLRVHVAPPSGVTLTVDKNDVALSEDGQATLLHDPGTVSVSVRDASGTEQRQTVTVAPGATVQMDFAVQPRPPRADQGRDKPILQNVEPSSPTQRWAWPAAIGSGGLTAAGLGVFIGFGLSSQATFDELEARCGRPPRCTAADRADADSGKQAQTVANIGLGVAAVAAVATIVFVLIATKGDRSRAALYRPFDAARPGPL